MPFSSADPNGLIAIGMQSALGSPQTSATKFRFAKFLASDIDVQMDAVDLREGGDGLDYGFTYKQKQKVAGQIVVNGRPEIAGQLLSQILGGATWDGGSAPAIHTAHTGHASFPWSTILAQQPGSLIPYFVSDVRFTGLTLSARSGQPWQFTFPFIGINHGASMAAVTPTYYGEEPFLFHSNPSYILDGLADSDITEFTLNLGYGIDEIQTQAVTLDEIPVLSRDATLSITRRLENPNLWQKVYYGASGNVAPTTAVATTSFRAVVAYGAAAALRSLDLNAQLLSLRGNKISGLDPDGKTVYEQIDTRVLRGATHMLFTKVTNIHASAYGS